MSQSGFDRRSLLRDVLTLFTGTTLAQLIPVAIQPILRRLFTPEEFGNFAIYISVSGTLIVIATLRYEMAVVIPEKDKEGINLAALSQLIIFVVCMVSFLAIYFFQDKFLSYLNIQSTDSGFIYLVPLSVFLFSSYQTYNYWLIRKKAFKQSAINKISRRTSEAICQTAFGFSHIRSGLISGDLIGRAAMMMMSVVQASRQKFNWAQINAKTLVQVAGKYKEFPLYNALPSVLNTASVMIPILLVTRFYSRATTGQVDLCVQLLGLPMALVSVAVSQVLYQRISECRQHSRHVKEIVSSVFRILLILAACGILLVELFGKWGVELIFGADWSAAGSFIMILVVSYGFRFVVSPLSIILTAMNKLKLLAIWQSCYFISVLCLGFLDFLDIHEFLLVYAGIDITAYCLYYLLIQHQVKSYEKTIE